jgi:hypothetical protein
LMQAEQPAVLRPGAADFPPEAVAEPHHVHWKLAKRGVKRKARLEREERMTLSVSSTVPLYSAARVISLVATRHKLS